MFSQQEYLKKLVDDIRHTFRSIVGTDLYLLSYAHQESIRQMQEQSPELFLDALPLNFDTWTRQFEDEMVEMIAPSLYKRHQKAVAEQQRAQLVNNIRHTFTAVFKRPRDMFSSLPSFSLQKKFKAANAREQLRNKEATGRVSPYRGGGLVKGLFTESGDDEWSLVPRPPENAVAQNKTGSRYGLKVFPENWGQTMSLVVASDAVLDTNSVVVTMKGGQKQAITIKDVQGYGCMTIPEQAIQIEYVDVPIVEQVPNASWQEYQDFANRYSDLSSSLSGSLPIDPRFQIQLNKFKGKSPFEALVSLESLVREVGIYDWNNQQTESDRENLTTSETLQYAVGRMDDIKRSNKKMKNNDALYAGVCHESSTLLMAALRELGFLAGRVSELRADTKGTFNFEDSHASAFVLWPSNNGGYQIIYLDGTFKSLDNRRPSPSPKVSLAERVKQSQVQLIDFNPPEDTEYINEAEVIEQFDEAQELVENHTQDKPLISKELVPSRQLNANTTLEEIGNLDLSILQVLYQLLQEVTYGPPGVDEVQAYLSLSTIDERWSWLKQQVLFRNDLSLGEDRVTARKSRSELINEIMAGLSK